MPYIVITTQFINPAYFCEFPLPGFKLSTDINEAQEHPTRTEAETACIELEKASGMKCEVKPIDR